MGSCQLQVEEMDGNRYTSLEVARKEALSDVAQKVVNVIRDGLAEKQLTVIDGVVRIDDDDSEE
jgi:hypothetical protein